VSYAPKAAAQTPQTPLAACRSGVVSGVR